jgi:septum formation protein
VTDRWRLVLASTSPRRRELLESIGVPHDVVAPPPEAEPPPGAVIPAEHARRAAIAKAVAVASRVAGRLVLGADTVVATGPSPRAVLGKPADDRDAEAMLRLLSGRTHLVITAVALARADAGKPSRR